MYTSHGICAPMTVECHEVLGDRHGQCAINYGVT